MNSRKVNVIRTQEEPSWLFKAFQKNQQLSIDPALEPMLWEECELESHIRCQRWHPHIELGEA